jgi:hypothetical protein
LGRKVRESQPFSVSEKKKTMTIKGQVTAWIITYIRDFF